MGRIFKFEILDEAVDSLEKIAEFTGREPIHVVIDALRTYEWILEEQSKGKKIVVMGGNLEEEEVQLTDFIGEGKEEEAQLYFNSR